MRSGGKAMQKYEWKKQTAETNLKAEMVADHDPIRDFIPDPSGVYVLIKIDSGDALISVALCSPDHRIFRVFTGKKSQDLYCGIFKAEESSDQPWFQSKDHIAYLGKELKKAETAIQAGKPYWQE